MWTSPITFVATANAAVFCGADVEFIDIDPRTGNLCVNRLEEQLILAKQQNRLPKIVSASYGRKSADNRGVSSLAKDLDLKSLKMLARTWLDL